MLEKYRATIRGNVIEWQDGGPSSADNLDVDVTVRESAATAQEPNGRRAMAALERIAVTGGIKSIIDPVAWQREIRKDRPLPGRE